MKVEIYECLNDEKPWHWKVTLGGKVIAEEYTTRRACVRGLWLWWENVERELLGYPSSGYVDHIYTIVYDAIRESRRGK